MNVGFWNYSINYVVVFHDARACPQALLQFRSLSSAQVLAVTAPRNSHFIVVACHAWYIFVSDIIIDDEKHLWYPFFKIFFMIDDIWID